MGAISVTSATSIPHSTEMETKASGEGVKLKKFAAKIPNTEQVVISTGSKSLADIEREIKETIADISRREETLDRKGKKVLAFEGDISAIPKEQLQNRAANEHELLQRVFRNTLLIGSGINLEEDYYKERGGYLVNRFSGSADIFNLNGIFVNKRRFNANLVDFEGFKAIAAGHPRPVDHELYLKMLFDRGSLIVSLNQPEDYTSGLRLDPEDLPLFPTKPGEVYTAGNMSIECISHKEDPVNKVNITQYKIKQKAPVSEKIITRVHYPWTDHAGISKDEIRHVINLIAEINLNDHGKPDEVPVINCSAGVGRTGTVIVMNELYRLHKDGKLNIKNLEATISQLILQGRARRGEKFVQTQEQTQALFEFGFYLLDPNNAKEIAEIESEALRKRP